MVFLYLGLFFLSDWNDKVLIEIYVNDEYQNVCNIYVYICMHVCIYIYVYAYTYTYIYTYVCVVIYIIHCHSGDH